MGKAAGRWLVGLGGLALLLTLVLNDQGLRGQDIEPPRKKKDGSAGLPASAYSSLKIKEQEGDKDFREKIELAHEYMMVKNWKVVYRAVQYVLNSPKDHYIQVRERDPSGREMIRWASAKYEANKILSTLPPAALDGYELEYGATAQVILEDAKTRGDKEKIAEVAQRFYFTRAGAEANDLLGTYFLDRGQYFIAALRFEKIIANPAERVKVSDLTLLKAALAFRHIGDVKNSELAWKKLYDRIGDAGMKLAGEAVSTVQLRKALETVPVGASSLNDWLSIRGNEQNTGQAAGSPPLLDAPIWSRPLLLAPEVTGGNELEGAEAKAAIEQALKKAEEARDRPVLPGSFPIAVGNLLVYRSHSAVYAVYLRDELNEKGEVVGKAGEISWKSNTLDGSLAHLLHISKKEGIASPTASAIQNWLNRYGTYPSLSGASYENNLIGTLSSDGKFVYFIDDLAIPATPDMLQPVMWSGGGGVPGAALTPKVKDLILANKLYAIDIKTGEAVWTLGTDKDGFDNSHFLGAPISIGGKLYILNERNKGKPNEEAELRLVCIDPDKRDPRNTHSPLVIEPIQYLGNVDQAFRITHYPGRRLTAVHMAYGDGLLLAPTYTGELLAIDLMTRSVAWSYPYRDQFPPPLPFVPVGGPPFGRPPMPGPVSTTEVKAGFFSYHPSPPAIANGKVVFAAPDANYLHCVNLNDGSLVWKKKQVEGDLYMAGVQDGKVLLVNKNHVTAWRVDDGSFAWRVPTGDLPSGQGVASNGIYYLPLKRGEILAIDIHGGKIKAHNIARTGSIPPPGNLLFSEGTVISQGPLEIVAYPQLAARLALVDKAVKENPANAAKLVERGELFLADGQIKSAVNDLEKALELAPAEGVVKRAKNRLYDALTELLLADFKESSGRYLKEFEALSKLGDTPQELALREAKFYRIVGQGRESLGELVAAYDMFHKFSKLSIHKELGAVAGLDDPSHKVPVEIWMRARVGSMINNAKEDQKGPLETRIAEEWKAVEARKDPAEIRYFVNTFDVPFQVGRNARISLAEAIVARGEKAAYLEAELYLQQVRVSKYRKTPAGGQALASLALLEEKKGSTESLKLAAAYYRELGKEFADVPVRGGLTGAALFNEMAADKRFLPYLEDAAVSWGAAKVAARELSSGGYDPSMQFYVLSPAGDPPPLMRRHRLLIDPTIPSKIRIQLMDLTTGKARWTNDLTTLSNPINDRYFNFLKSHREISNVPHDPNAHFRSFHCKGHLIVVQIGAYALCLHADTGDVLWTQVLSEVTIPVVPGVGALELERVAAGEDGYLEIFLWNRFNNMKTPVPLGHVATVQASYVALVTNKGLQVLDPLRGTLLWKKTDVTPSASRVFGDENFLYLIENPDPDSTPSGRVLNAADGTPVDASPDFGPLYQYRLKIEGRTLLAAVPTRGGLNLRLYDIPTGKDVWNKLFPEGRVLESHDSDLTGVVDPAGNVVILNALTGEELVKTNVLKSQIAADDLKNLHRPMLLVDADRYYLALNKAVDGDKVTNGTIGNNFSNGLRCAPVNGWLLALKRGDGEEKVGAKVRTRKNGDFLWHTFKPVVHQMIVLEQFEEQPVLLLTSRINEKINLGAGGIRWVTTTQSLDRRTGKMIYDSGPGSTTGAPQFHGFTLDTRAGLVTMTGLRMTLQHYIDDGRKLPPGPVGGVGAGLFPGGGPAEVGLVPPPPGFLPPGGGGIMPRPILVRPPIRAMPLPIEKAPIKLKLAPPR